MKELNERGEKALLPCCGVNIGEKRSSFLNGDSEGYKCVANTVFMEGIDLTVLKITALFLWEYV